MSVLLAGLIIVSAALGQQTPSNPAAPPRGKKSVSAAVKKVDKHFPDVAWTSSFDKFKGRNQVDLILRNISAKDPNYFMDITSLWDSAQQEDKPSARRPWNSITFGSSLDSSGAKFAQTEGVLLLNNATRVYLTGSQACGFVKCNQRKIRNHFEPWVIADLASANKVEGKVDGIEFALKNDQIAAIGEFLTSRRLVWFADVIAKWQGKTAREAAIAIDQSLRGYDRNLEFELSDLRIFGLTNQMFSFDFVLHADDRAERQSQRTEVQLGDLLLFGIDANCYDGYCVKYTVLRGKSDPGGDKGDLMSGAFGADLKDSEKHGLAYIYYRVMYCDDSLSFYPN